MTDTSHLPPPPPTPYPDFVRARQRGQTLPDDILASPAQLSYRRVNLRPLAALGLFVAALGVVWVGYTARPVPRAPEPSAVVASAGAGKSTGGAAVQESIAPDAPIPGAWPQSSPAPARTQTAQTREAGTGEAGVETTPGRPRKGLLKATQYFDPGEGRPVGTRVEPPLRTGDFVTVLPYTINYEWLYCLIIGPSNNYKLSKLYTVEALRGGSVPLKFTAKSSKEGTFQVLLVATREELPDIQLYIQKANLAAVSKGKEKEERTKGLLDILTANLPEGEWGHLTLDPIPFKP